VWPLCLRVSPARLPKKDISTGSMPARTRPHIPGVAASAVRAGRPHAAAGGAGTGSVGP